MDNQTIQYKCPTCASTLRYDVSGKLVCDTCGNRYELEYIKSFFEAKEKEEGFDWGDYKKSFSENKARLENSVVYICRSCGAAIETDNTTAATTCPYCDNEVVITDKLSGGIRPNALIPFRIDKKAAEQAVRNHFKGKTLLPNDFKSKHKLEKIKGVYVPFWLFDSGVDGSMRFDGTKVKHYSDSEYNYTETEHYRLDIEGSMNFSRVPVDGSEKMDDDLMDAIEPFDYSGLVDYDPAYLTGFLADRFDEDPDESLPRATSRMKSCTEAVFEGQVSQGFSSVTATQSDLNLFDQTVKYVLLPVYLLNMKYGDKKYRFAVNGQTGKVVGELPVSKLKKFLHSWVFGGAVMGVMTFLAYLLFR